MQQFISPILTEGVLTSSIMAIGRSLTEPEYDLEQQLCLFARDEVITWLHNQKRPWSFDINFRNTVANAIEGVVKRAEAMACKVEREQAASNPTNLGQTPVIQTITNLISISTNPLVLVRMQEMYNPWF